MWFGDYVTMAWWNDLWLNESFASWLAHAPRARAASAVAARRGARSSARKAIELDRLADRARRCASRSPNTRDVRAAFDSITYAKGETVLAMFEQWLGPDKFREGVRRYVAKHAWGNATAEDFFAALAASDDAIVPAVSRLRRAPGRAAARRRARLHGRAVAGADAAAFRSRGAQAPRRTRPASDKWVFPACFEFGDATRAAQVVHARARREADGAAAGERVPAMGRRQSQRHRLLPAAAVARALRRAAQGGSRARRRRLRAAAGRPRRSLSRGGAVGYQVDAARSPRARRRAPTRAWRAAPTRSRTACPPRSSIPPTRRATPRGSGTTSATARARWAGCRARARPRTCCACATRALPLVAVRGQDAALARKAQQLAQRWITHRSAIPPEARRTILVAAARTSDKDAAKLFDALLRGRERQQGRERARRRVSWRSARSATRRSGRALR